MFNKIAPLAMLAILTGCATHNVQLYGPIDSSNKTVTVPPGSEGPGQSGQCAYGRVALLTQSSIGLTIGAQPRLTAGHFAVPLDAPEPVLLQVDSFWSGSVF